MLLTSLRSKDHSVRFIVPPNQSISQFRFQWRKSKLPTRNPEIKTAKPASQEFGQMCLRIDKQWPHHGVLALVWISHLSLAKTSPVPFRTYRSPRESKDYVKEHTAKPGPGWPFFKGPQKFLPSSGVTFKKEFPNKEITKAHPIEMKFLCLQPGCAQAGFNCLENW